MSDKSLREYGVQEYDVGEYRIGYVVDGEDEQYTIFDKADEIATVDSAETALMLIRGTFSSDLAELASMVAIEAKKKGVYSIENKAGIYISLEEIAQLFISAIGGTDARSLDTIATSLAKLVATP